MNKSLSYCGQVVREQDPDRFLLSMFAPADPPSFEGLRRDISRREALWALFAFNYEIAKTREVVSETQLGLIRLQWWREAIGKIYDTGEVLEHEVLKPLARAIKNYNLSRGMFETLIYAREFDLENVCPSTLDGLFNYMDFTTAPLMNLAMAITGGDAEMDPVQAVATNYALVGVLRSVRYYSLQRRALLPEDLMKKHGVTLKQIYDFQKPEAGFPDMVQEIAGYFVPKIRPESRFLKASQVLAEIYMGQIKGLKYDVFSPKIAVSPAFKELRLALGLLS